MILYGRTNESLQNSGFITLMNYIYFQTICRNLKASVSVQKHNKIVNMMFNYLVFCFDSRR
ncbi:hypothetical protein RchiOBHm_Chr7g0232781 [Rosa chinensis]|uniref:Uncharacterized protein n=1 Tax=Rosa chinensis TaxID=74649 RepID=A0A2P6PG03_ROSCH|nr:hypothetical protein RchiOBHm_Chr7g0232781 [Rosa chinensis]